MPSVRGVGLEPTHTLSGFCTSGGRVCQFHHPRTLGTENVFYFFLGRAFAAAGAAGAGFVSWGWAAAGAVSGPAGSAGIGSLAGIAMECVKVSAVLLRAPNRGGGAPS